MVADKDNEFGLYQGECVACAVFDQLHDIGLCEECAGKLERDLVRERDWEYCAAAYALTDGQREDLHRKVILQFGREFELLAPHAKGKDKVKRRKRRP